ncbi:MAG: adenine deaminase [Chitinophagales bacterium]|nr:adenine deaminase [Chitinophagales bacterium]
MQANKHDAMKTISGNIVDISAKRIFEGAVAINDLGKIESIQESAPHIHANKQYILPGFIDAHIHIESSMITPYAFAQAALVHGTIATLSDPHEIANVCGIDGVQYMIDNAKDAMLKIFWGAPSCVPATNFENTGATLPPSDIDRLLQMNDIWYLSEMMNYPGVINGDPEVHRKIELAKKYQKPIDGHAPGLRGDLVKKYISYGISTDHECYTLDEALEKLQYGMKIIIREGSAARNFEALHPLIQSHPNEVMFCSDDKHPNDLEKGHINLLVRAAIQLGYDLFDVLQIACINPIHHYKIPVGQLRPGDPADFIIVEGLDTFHVTSTYINGIRVAHEGKSMLPNREQPIINQFNTNIISEKDIVVPASRNHQPIIIAIDRMLITEKAWVTLPTQNGQTISNPQEDILKICVVNRYQNAKPAVGFIKNFGCKGCAIASTVAHDSHNIVAVGDDDALITKAINLLIASKGGLSAVTHDEEKHLPLPIAGLMSNLSVDVIGAAYEDISSFVKSKGSQLEAPFMTLSFMALLVIPKIKISDLGMFDAEAFQFYE